jgi:hypothetical protein
MERLAVLEGEDLAGPSMGVSQAGQEGPDSGVSVGIMATSVEGRSLGGPGMGDGERPPQVFRSLARCSSIFVSRATV